MKRVFLIVLDSFGCGEMPDAADFGDAGSNTLRSCAETGILCVPNMAKLGLFEIDGVKGVVDVPKATAEGSVSAAFSEEGIAGVYGRLAELSKGKDTTTGHWEIAGLISEQPMPTFPDGFPQELLDKLEEKTGRKILCNKPYSGTEVIKDYGKEHLETGALIVYTSADSVLQIAAHDSIVDTETLYEYCRMAREICQGKWGVGRVIARPFTGEWPYTRTPLRHDFSLVPPKETMLVTLQKAGVTTRSVGKIIDIFAEQGIEHFVRTSGNAEGIERIFEELRADFSGLSFINLVDFDMLYGHRNDPMGYANALNTFDKALGDMLPLLREEDLLLITADHGCDPATESTDHSREYIPLLVYGKNAEAGKNFGTRQGFCDIAKTILSYLEVENTLPGAAIELA